MDDEDWQFEEIKKLETRIAELVVENHTLNQRLEKKKYDEVYRENHLL